MRKVLSTKVTLDELERFAEMAERQGESKSGLLRRLVLDYLNSDSKADRAASIGTPHPAKSSSSQGVHSTGLLSVNRQQQTGSPVITSTENVSVQNVEIVDQNADSLASSRDSVPVYQARSKGRPEASPKPRPGGAWLPLLVILGLWLNSKRTVTVDGKSAFTTQPPQVEEPGLYTFKVGNTIVYSSSPIPFW